MYSRRAFTLVELLVVISIVSMLASIIMVQISLAQASGRDSVRTQQIRQIDLATQMYIETHKKAPLVDTGCSVLSSGQVTEAEASACFAVSTAKVEINPDQYNKWQAFKLQLSEFIDIPEDPCRGTCIPADPAFPIGYTYVAPRAYQYYCQNGGDCIATDESYQVYAPMERETVPSGSEGATDAYATDPLVAQGNDEDAPSVPGDPYIVKSGQPGAEIFDFMWTASTDGSGTGVEGYTVSLNINGGEPSVGDTTETTFRAGPYLPWGSTACFTVLAYDQAGNESDQTSPVCEVVVIPGQGDIVSAPTGFNATYTNNGPTYSVTFSWNPSSSIQQGASIDHYNIYKDGFNLMNIIGTSFSRSNSSWNPAISPYCVAVTAVDSYGNESLMSEEECLP